jgi:hypothetical protein
MLSGRPDYTVLARLAVVFVSPEVAFVSPEAAFVSAGKVSRLRQPGRSEAADESCLFDRFPTANLPQYPRRASRRLWPRDGEADEAGVMA